MGINVWEDERYDQSNKEGHGHRKVEEAEPNTGSPHILAYPDQIGSEPPAQLWQEGSGPCYFPFCMGVHL